MRRFATISGAVLIAACTNGGPYFNPEYKTIPERQDLAGYASASVVSLRALEDIENDFFPLFDLTFADAITLIEGAARRQTIATAAGVRLGISLGLSGDTLERTDKSSLKIDEILKGNSQAQRELTANSQTTTANGNEPTRSADSTRKFSSTATKDATRSDVRGRERTETRARVQGQPGTPTLTGELPTSAPDFLALVEPNPALVRQAAAQLVLLSKNMGRAFKDAPVGAGRDGYIVEIRASLQPHKPFLPLDAFLTLVLLPDLTNLDPSKPPEVTISPLAIGNEDYEFEDFGTAAQFMAGLSASLSAINPAGAAAAKADAMYRRQTAAAAQNTNGLANTTSLAPNAQQIRLGAMWQGAVDRAMVARTYHAFFIITTPAGYKGKLNLVTKAAFRDPTTGRRLPGTSPREVEKEIAREFCDRRLVLLSPCPTGADPSGGDHLFDFFNRLRRNDLSALACVSNLQASDRALKDTPTCEHSAAAIVVAGPRTSARPERLDGFVSEIFRVGLIVRNSTTTLVLPPNRLAPKPKVPQPAVLPPNQLTIARDDGDLIEITLLGGSGLEAKALAASDIQQVMVRRSVRDPVRGQVQLPNIAVKVREGAVDLTYPSLLGLGVDRSRLDQSRPATISLTYADAKTKVTRVYNVVLPGEEPTVAAPATNPVALLTPRLNIKDATAPARVSVAVSNWKPEKRDLPLTVRVEGAEVIEIIGSANLRGTLIYVDSPGVISLGLSNIPTQPKAIIKLEAAVGSQKYPALTVPVVLVKQ